MANASVFDRLIDHRPGSDAGGTFRIHRDTYRNPAIFDLEMRHLFEGG